MCLLVLCVLVFVCLVGCYCSDVFAFVCFEAVVVLSFVLLVCCCCVCMYPHVCLYYRVNMCWLVCVALWIVFSCVSVLLLCVCGLFLYCVLRV